MEDQLERAFAIGGLDRTQVVTTRPVAANDGNFPEDSIVQRPFRRENAIRLPDGPGGSARWIGWETLFNVNRSRFGLDIHPASAQRNQALRAAHYERERNEAARLEAEEEVEAEDGRPAIPPQTPSDSGEGMRWQSRRMPQRQDEEADADYQDGEQAEEQPSTGRRSRGDGINTQTLPNANTIEADREESHRLTQGNNYIAAAPVRRNTAAPRLTPSAPVPGISSFQAALNAANAARSSASADNASYQTRRQAPRPFAFDDNLGVEIAEPYRSPYETQALPGAAEQTTLPGHDRGLGQVHPAPEEDNEMEEDTFAPPAQALPRHDRGQGQAHPAPAEDNEMEEDVAAPPAQAPATPRRTVADSQVRTRPSRLPVPRVTSAPSAPTSAPRISQGKTASGKVSKSKKKGKKDGKKSKIGSSFADPNLDHSKGRYQGPPPPPPGGAAGAVSS